MKYRNKKIANFNTCILHSQEVNKPGATKYG